MAIELKKCGCVIATAKNTPSVASGKELGGYVKVECEDCREQRTRPTPVAPVSPDATKAARDVLAERKRQVEAEGWTPEHDDTHTGGEMAGAAACYALYGATYNAPSHYPPRKVYAAVAEARRNAEKDVETTREAVRMAIGAPKAPKNWPWNAEWWKPSDRRRNLVKAAALILAEIERLDREASEGGSNV
ncbi:hypothetical protein F9K85_09640 [Brucella tritici]|uniref:hypothetical protein n=1 Tax=Brucella tritici TaxID=94626 RepID=UPI00124EA494|nr:hypothetical protein [Brucella tritici]KAB2676748.1 hypothetical protein F9K85_09640 [Brucella tritici]